ncbi:MAG TPA: hypothetical protein VG604_04735 [Candidatus Saccharimonadales bacterium]|nr:hypothetical protein [Candidatus Saccharimonadales bacterium]
MANTHSVETDHAFTPQGQIARVINAFHGLLDLDTVPSYYQPTPAAYEFSAKLLDIVNIDKSAALLFEGDNADVSARAAARSLSSTGYGLTLVVGPANLRAIVGDLDGPSPFLWDRDTVRKYQLMHGRLAINDQIEKIYGKSK